MNGSGFSGVAVSWKVDNFELRNLRIVGNAGGSCLQPTSGTALQYKGLSILGCAFEGGTNGLICGGYADFVVTEDCYAAASITGWGFNASDPLGNGRSGVFVNCIADSVNGFAASSGMVFNCIGCKRPWDDGLW